MYVCTPGWAGRGSRALKLRLGHPGWGTGVHRKGSNCPSHRVGGACLRPMQCLRGLGKEGGAETGAGLDGPKNGEKENKTRTEQREKKFKWGDT